MVQNTRITLLNRLRDATDAMAWDEFFSCYWPVVFAYAQYRGCSRHTAQDVVQDVMLTVFEQRDVFRYDPARGRFRNWLHRVVNNHVAQRRRRPSERIRSRGGDGSEALLEHADSAATPDAEWDASFERAVLAATVRVVQREFNPREFVAFELTALRGRAPGEAARLTGMTRNMVYKARRKIVERLRELASDFAEEGHLCRRVREALESFPDAHVERSVTAQVAESMCTEMRREAVGSASGAE